MAYRPHFLLQFGGTLYGSEIWSCSLRMANPVAGASSEDPANYLQDMTNDVRTFINSSVFNTQTVLTFVKFNKINEQGRYASAQESFTSFLSGTSGPLATGKGTSTTYVPPQSTLAVTLHTARVRGPGSRGRFFVPAPAVAAAVGADGRLAAGDVGPVSSLGLQVQTLLTNLNNHPGFDAGQGPRVVVATPGGRGAPEGDNVPVTGWSIGRVVDTQRSRRNALLEAPTIKVL
jgi:hypothetical protein